MSWFFCFFILVVERGEKLGSGHIAREDVFGDRGGNDHWVASPDREDRGSLWATTVAPDVGVRKAQGVVPVARGVVDSESTLELGLLEKVEGAINGVFDLELVSGWFDVEGDLTLVDRPCDSGVRVKDNIGSIVSADVELGEVEDLKQCLADWGLGGQVGRRWVDVDEGAEFAHVVEALEERSLVLGGLGVGLRVIGISALDVFSALFRGSSSKGLEVLGDEFLLVFELVGDVRSIVKNEVVEDGGGVSGHCWF